MRVIYLYFSDGAASTPNHNIQYEDQDCTNRFASLVHEDGLTYIVKSLLERSNFDELLIVIESTRGPGKRKLDSVTELLVVPHVNDLFKQLRPDDIIFARGGFRSWFQFLQTCKDKGNWLMLYAANTGREKWGFWDVVLDDLSGRTFWSKEKLHLEYRKPVRPDIFYPMETLDSYDFMIGASHIHDKKGQWKVIDALIEYKKKYGECPRCIMPGAPRRGVHSNLNMEKIEKYELNVEVPSMLSRKILSLAMNKSKYFIHAGNGGQNDRGPLEAMRCGCHTIITTPQRHSPTLYQGPGSVCSVMPNAYTPLEMADYLRSLMYIPTFRKEIFEHYEQVNGFETVIMPAFTKLFNIFKENPTRNTEALKDAYGKS